MQLFNLGRVVATPGVLEALERLNVNPLLLIGRHVSGDFGDLSDDDQQANVRALQEGSRVFSAYEIAGERIWVITEADRSSTCILLPHEY
jgi:hypothetical protein